MNRNARRKQEKMTGNPVPQSVNTVTVGNLQTQLQQVWNYHNKRDFAAAETLCHQILTAFPHDVDAWNFLGAVYREQKRINEAVACFHRALTINPTYHRALYNLANIMMAQKDYPNAIALFKSVLQHQPKHLNAMMKLSDACLMMDDAEQAVAWAKKVLILEPNSASSWQLFQSAFSASYYKPAPDAEFETFLVESLSVPERISSVMQSVLINYTLQVLPGVLNLCQLATSNFTAELKVSAECGAVEMVFAHPLLAGLLQHMPFPALGMEYLLRQLRGIYTDALLADPVQFFGKRHAFLLTLASQCQLTEHVYFMDEKDKASHVMLRERVATMPPTHSEEYIAHVLLLATYQKLDGELWAERFIALSHQADVDMRLQQFIQEFVAEPLEERAIRATIPALTTIGEGVSTAVREQYEENPYPRWRYVQKAPQSTAVDVMKFIFPQFDHSRIRVGDPCKILIAGCGTGAHPIMTAGRFAGAEALAIDLSLSSLAYAQRKIRELCISNITLMQADIMKLDDVDGEYDIVESGGVLHHLEHPLKGWEIITRKLKSGGLMKIGLYSQLARESVNVVRQNISMEGRMDDVDSIRAYRHQIMQFPLDKKIEHVFNTRDFFSMSECRDLLFHRQEHQFTIPKLKETITSLGLEFIGFENTQLLVTKAYRERFPEDRAMNSLDNWHQFEIDNPKSFLSMYQFWCFKP